MTDVAVRKLVELTDDEAKQLGGNALTVPKHGVKFKTDTWGRGTENEREVETATWKEVGILDGIEQNTKIKEDRFKGYPHEPYEPEAWMVKWRISQTDKLGDIPTENGGRVITQFEDFIFSLKHVPMETLTDYADRFKGTSDPRRFWRMRFFELQKAVQRMAAILRFAGHTDRLSGGRYFKGFGPVFDILPTLRGQKYLITIEQQEGSDGTPRDKVVKVEEFTTFE